MALTLRKRGAVWHARGTVRVGRETVHVPEFSTGCHSHADAKAVAAKREADERAALLEGPAGRARSLTVGDCLAAYLQRPGGVRERDKQPIRDMGLFLGGRALAEAPRAWEAWADAHPGHSPGTLAKYRNVLRAALRHGAARNGIEAPKLPPVREPRVQPVPVLTDDERRRLLAAYSPAPACPVLLLAYQGSRTGETLALDWRHVDCRKGTIRFVPENTKSGKGRAVPMHPKVSLLLWGMWEAAGRPHAGPLFLNARGRPYGSQRDEGGGSALATAHATACRRAGVRGFRIHDWRHDYAARMVMAGVDLLSLQQLGGWEDLRSVKRYASVTADHLREAARRIT